MLLLWMLVTAINQPGNAQSPEEQWQAAGTAYVRGEYREALKAYQQLEASGYRSAALFYNMGNATYRLDEKGLAVFYFLKARHLKPLDRSTRHNLSLVREQLRDQISPLRPFFLYAWWQGAYFLAPAWLWAALGIGSWLLGAGLPARAWLLQRSLSRYLPIVLFVLGMVFLALAWSRHQWDEDPGLAVILEPEVAMHVAPDPQSALAKTLHEGTTVHPLDSLGDWLKIKLPNGEQGWLRGGALGQIP
jgi:tetratricopeptide (TPR) repeat protein